MADVRIQVATFKTGALAVDHIVNTVYFRDINLDPGAGTDWLNLAVETRDAFRLREQIPTGYVIQATAYDMDDVKPRPVKGFAAPLAPNVPSAADAGPREVALCLSYFSERNVPRKRGRIYLGPFNTGALPARPFDSTIGFLGALAGRLAGVGGIDVDWSLYSPTAGGLSKITNWWVDDEWDTIRSRGMKPTKRTSGTTGE
jgi:hypothetical protein